MTTPLRKSVYESPPDPDPIEQRIQEEEDFFSLVADRQEDLGLPFFPDPEGTSYV